MFAISICLAWWALWVWLGGPASGLVLTWLLTFPFWSDIWCRLGCSEAHATLGTAMVGAAAAAIVLEMRRLRVLNRARWNSYWALLAAGAILAVGAKENFLILLPIVWVLMAWVARRRPLGIVPWLAGTAITLAGFWVAGVIMVATSHAGVDVYQQPTGMVHRLQALIDWMKTGVGATWVCLGCVAVGLMVMLYFAGRPGPARRLRRRHAVLSSSLLFALFAATVLSQVFFYNGTFPSQDHTRYDFPGLIAAALAAVTAVELIMGFLAPLPSGEGGRYSGRVWAWPTNNPRTNGTLAPQNPASTVTPRPHPAGVPATLSRPRGGEGHSTPRAGTGRPGPARPQPWLRAHRPCRRSQCSRNPELHEQDRKNQPAGTNPTPASPAFRGLSPRQFGVCNIRPGLFTGESGHQPRIPHDSLRHQTFCRS